jgi:hypothetical protein
MINRSTQLGLNKLQVERGFLLQQLRATAAHLHTANPGSLQAEWAPLPQQDRYQH